MSEKIIHIVFQVLNFLSTPSLSSCYYLTADEKLLLLFLAKHKGKKGIYPSVLTLSKELQRSDSAIRRSLNRLKTKNLILIEHCPGKSSQYTLVIPCEELSTTPSVDASTYEQPLASTLVHPRRPRQYTPSVDARQSVRGNNKDIKKERAQTARSPLSDFVANDANTLLAMDFKLDLTEELQSFKNRHNGKGNLQYEFERWLKNSQKYLSRQSNGVSAQETRRSVPDWGVGHPSYDALHAQPQKAPTSAQPQPQPLEEPHIPFREVVRLHKFKQQQGMLTNETNLPRDIRRGVDSK